jgi:hypothetical protein
VAKGDQTVVRFFGQLEHWKAFNKDCSSPVSILPLGIY